VKEYCEIKRRDSTVLGYFDSAFRRQAAACNEHIAKIAVKTFFQVLLFFFLCTHQLKFLQGVLIYEVKYEKENEEIRT